MQKTIISLSILLALSAARATEYEQPKPPKARATAIAAQQQSTRVRIVNNVQPAAEPKIASVPAPSATGGSVSGSGNAAVTVHGDAAQERNPVSTAYAPALTVGNGVCAGSTSVGGQGGGLGVSFGTTWRDDGCEARYDAMALHAAGLPQVAIARLCQRPAIAQAMADAGTPCPGQKKAASGPPDAPVSHSSEPASDPYIAARLAKQRGE